MADSIRPWLSEYLIGSGERFGGDLAAAPLFTKNKKVQLIEFLTYELTTQDDCIWAKVSDKRYKIPVRFSSTAMSEYNRANRRRLTENKTAIISIKDFKPFFARVPLGFKRGMSEKAYLALEVNHISVIGSIGEGQWGSPQEVEMNHDLRLWSEGLRQHGGGGNILQEKKKEREQAPDANVVTKPPLGHQRASVPSTAKKRAYAGNNVSGPKSTDKPAPVPDKFNLLKEYERSWRPIYRAFIWKPEVVKQNTDGGQAANVPLSSENVTEELHVPQRTISMEYPGRIGRNVLDLDSSPPEVTSHSPKGSPEAQSAFLEKQTTPLPEEWPPSSRGTPELVYVSAEEDNASDDEQPFSSPSEKRGHGSYPHLENSSPTSDHSVELTPPTPAQRQKPYIPEPSLSPPASPGPSSTLTLDRLSPTSSRVTHSHARRQVARKVPYPSQPLPLKTSFSGPPRVLVPNSDTSQSQSQSQSQLRPSKLVSQNNHFGTQEGDVTHPASKDESDVELFGLSQPGSYHDDKPLLNQLATIKDEPDFDEKPVFPYARDDTGGNISTASTSERLLQNIPDDECGKEESNEQFLEESGELLLANAKFQIKKNGSVVPDSQEDQLDDDDAQIDDALFGEVHSDEINHFAMEIDPIPKARSSTPNGLAIAQSAPANSSRNLSKSQVPSMSIPRPPNLRQFAHSSRSSSICRASSPSRSESRQGAPVPILSQGAASHDASDHNAEAWQLPTFMQNANNKGKGKEKAISLEHGKGRTVNSRPGQLSESRHSSLGSEANKRRTSSGTYLDNHRSGMTKVVMDTSGPADERAAEDSRIDLLVASGRRSKRTREISLDGSTDDNNTAEGSWKKRKVADSTSNGNESDSKRSGDHEKQDVTDRGRLKRDATPGGHVDGKNLVIIKDEQAEKQAEGTAGSSAKTKLDGFTVNFENFRPNLPCTAQYNQTEPPWFSWQMLAEVLLRTGRQRTKQGGAKKAKTGEPR